MSTSIKNTKRSQAIYEAEGTKKKNVTAALFIDLLLQQLAECTAVQGGHFLAAIMMAA